MTEPVDVSAKPPMEEVHLGDGLFASFDGFQLKLRAPRYGGDDECFLEPMVFINFIEYVKQTPMGPLLKECVK